MKICLIIDSFDRVRFFEKFSDVFKSHEVYYISHLRKLNIDGFSEQFSKVTGSVDPKFLSNLDIESSLEYCLNKKSVATKRYAYGLDLAINIINELDIDLFVYWNGAQAFSKGVYQASKLNGVKNLFFELSNIPNRIFVDGQGVNKNSSIYNEVEKLSRVSYSKHEREDFENSYTRYLSGLDEPPQKNIKTSNLAYFSQLIHNPMEFINLNNLNKLLRKLQRGNVENTIESTTLPDSYTFVPLQVSEDTQLLMNSSVNNEDLLAILAKDKSRNFVFKIHPCELPFYRKVIYDFISKYDHFYLSSLNTYSLICNSNDVITINSTVGLEAIFLGKETRFYGESLYSKLNRELLFSYALGCLVDDVNYFDNEKLTQEKFNELISYAN